MTRILLTGSQGQLGRCIQDSFRGLDDYSIKALDRADLDITDQEAIDDLFLTFKPHFCINAAAYTQVDKAESEYDEAFRINAQAVAYLATTCDNFGTTLIHISTDYVFDGTQRVPYRETDPIQPVNAYGRSKAEGEALLASQTNKHFVLRTSWLYSQYGHNFLATVRRVLGEGNNMKVVTNQFGNPTNTNDLAKAIKELITSGSEAYGIYNYSNAGGATWYDFALAIATFDPHLDPTLVGKTDDYRTFAQRPGYSVLDCTKWEGHFQTPIRHWKTSLQELISETS